MSTWYMRVKQPCGPGEVAMHNFSLTNLKNKQKAKNMEKTNNFDLDLTKSLQPPEIRHALFHTPSWISLQTIGIKLVQFYFTLCDNSPTPFKFQCKTGSVARHT